MLFSNTSPNNAGAYNNPMNDTLITNTLQARTSSQFYAAMYNWQHYLAGQLPVVYQPNTATLHRDDQRPGYRPAEHRPHDHAGNVVLPEVSRELPARPDS